MENCSSEENSGWVELGLVELGLFELGLGKLGFVELGYRITSGILTAAANFARISWLLTK